MEGRFFSTAFCGNPVDAPAKTTANLSAWPTRPASLVELLQHPDAPKHPIEPFELGLLNSLLHGSEDRWSLIREWKWGSGSELVVKRHTDSHLFNGALFGRYTCVLPKATLQTCAYCICNADERSRWDGQGYNYETRGAGDMHGCETTYFAVHMGFPLSSRDFLSYHSLYPHPTCPGGILLYMRHATDDLRPPTRDFVRGRLVVNAIEMVERPQGGVELTFMSCIEAGLPVSPWLVNMFIPGKMRLWFGNLDVRCSTLGATPPVATEIPLCTKPARASNQAPMEDKPPHSKEPSAALKDKVESSPHAAVSEVHASLPGGSSIPTTAGVGPSPCSSLPVEDDAREELLMRPNEKETLLESTSVNGSCWRCSCSVR